MPINIENQPHSQELFEAILKLENQKEAASFLRDLLTEAEIAEFSKRWKAARMLDKKIAYSQIEKETKLSSTTIARISKWLKQGKGGYQMMIERFKK